MFAFGKEGSRLNKEKGDALKLYDVEQSWLSKEVALKMVILSLYPETKENQIRTLEKKQAEPTSD